MKYAVKVGVGAYLLAPDENSFGSVRDLEDATLFASASKALCRAVATASRYAAEHPAWGFSVGQGHWDIVEVEEIAQPRYREGRTL